MIINAHAVNQRGQMSIASLLTATALLATVMASLILVLINAYAAIAMGIVAGAAVGSGVGRWRSRRGDHLPSH